MDYVIYQSQKLGFQKIYRSSGENILWTSENVINIYAKWYLSFNNVVFFVDLRLIDISENYDLYGPDYLLFYFSDRRSENFQLCKATIFFCWITFHFEDFKVQRLETKIKIQIWLDPKTYQLFVFPSTILLIMCKYDFGHTIWHNMSKN